MNYGHAAYEYGGWVECNWFKLSHVKTGWPQLEGKRNTTLLLLYEHSLENTVMLYTLLPKLCTWDYKVYENCAYMSRVYMIDCFIPHHCLLLSTVQLYTHCYTLASFTFTINRCLHILNSCHAWHLA